MVWLGTDPGEQLRWVDTMERARAKGEQAASGWDEAKAQRAAMIARIAPWMPTGAMLALAKGPVMSMEPVINAATWAGVTRARVNPTNSRPGMPVRGAQLDPGNRVFNERERRRLGGGQVLPPEPVPNRGAETGLFGREREQVYFSEVQPEIERAAQRLKREEAFLGRAPGDMREGVSTLDDLAREGFWAAGSLVAPFNMLGEEDSVAGLRERFRGSENSAAAQRSLRFLDILERMAGRRRLTFIDSDQELAVYFPADERGGPRIGSGQLYSEYRRPSQLGTAPWLLDLASRGLSAAGGRALSEYLDTHRLPTLNDIPGVRGSPAELPEAQAFGMQTAGAPSGREFIQTGLMATMFPLQEAVGQVRNIYGAATGRSPDWGEPQSDYLIAIDDHSLDPGRGFIVDPDSELAEERRRRERERGTIYGEIITPGRLVSGAAASMDLIEPGTKPYRVLSGLIDAGVQIYADPTVLAARRLSRVSEARQVFTADAPETIRAAAGATTSRLRGLASTLGVPGRAAMGRDDLAAALRGVDPVAGRSVTELRHLAATLGVKGRTRMPRADLEAAIRTSWDAMAEVVPGRSITRTGLVRGMFSRDVHGDSTSAWLDGPEGSTIVGLLTDLAVKDDGYGLWWRTGRRLLPAEVAQLKAAKSTDAMREALAPMLITRFRKPSDVWYEPSALLRPIVDSRALTDIPDPFINLSRPDEHLDMAQRWLRNVRAPREVEESFVTRFIDAADDREATIDTVKEMIDYALGHVGFRNPAHRAYLVESWHSEIENVRRTLQEQATDQRLFDELYLDPSDAAGATLPLGNPFDFLEHAEQILMLPDPRRMRRLASDFAPIVGTAEGELRLPLRVLQAWQEEIWKPFTLLRGAWPVRFVGEEQFRIAARGHASMVKDPATYVVFATTRKQDALKKPLEEARQYVEGLGARSGGWGAERSGRMSTGRDIPYAKTDTRFAGAWGHSLVELSEDQVARVVAQAGDLDEAERLLQGSDIWANKVAQHPNVLGPDPEGTLRPYIEMASRHIEHRTGGNVQLLDAVRTGKYDGKAIFNADELRASGDFVKALAARHYDAAPDRILGPEVVTFADTRRERFVEWAFNILGGKTTRFLSRSPEFKQSYWDRISEMVPFLTPKAKQELIENAREVFQVDVGPLHFGRRAINKMERAEARGTMTLAQIDEVAKGYALDEVRDLLYDLSRRSQVFDAMRIVSPFGEAWREVVTRWATLLNPTSFQGIKNIRRAQQMIEGARGTQFGEVMDAPQLWDPTEQGWVQQGFFWRDEFGEEVFVYPGSQWVMARNVRLPDWVPLLGGMGTPGIEVPLTGRVGGLNMVGSIFPGLGPVASVPTSWFLPDKPGFTRTIREFLLPFGAVTEQGSAALLDLVNFAPPWMRTGFQALMGGGFDYNSNRIYANSVMSVANYLYSTGRYDTSTQEGQQKLMEDAKQAAGNVYLIRSLVAFGAPAAPSPDWLVETNEGLIRLAMLRDDYYRLLGEDVRTADEKFLERWGKLIAEPGQDMVGMAMQAFTREITGGVGVTEEWVDWTRTGAGRYLETNFPLIYAYLGPQEGKFDYDAYLRGILRGDREQLTLEEWMELGQHHLGAMQVDAARTEIALDPGDPEEDRAYIAQVTDWVWTNYPGYKVEGRHPSVESRVGTEDVIRELAVAMEDKRVLDTPTGKAIKDYWDERLVSLQVAADLGYTVRGPYYDMGAGTKLADERAYLYELGEYLATQDDGFDALWKRHLRNEVEPSEAELAEAGLLEQVGA